MNNSYNPRPEIRPNWKLHEEKAEKHNEKNEALIAKKKRHDDRLLAQEIKNIKEEF